MQRRWARAALVTGLVALLALAGCGAYEGSEDSAAEAGAEPGQMDRAAPPLGAADGDDGGEAGELATTRAIIYIGEITVRVEDVDQAASRAGAIAQRYGGFVGGDRRTSDGEHSTASLELRIPAENFHAAVADLAGLGEEEQRWIETEDVTSEMVDLQTRINTAQASVDRTRDLLAEADSVTEIVAIERELTAREETLGRLQARQRTLTDLTDLSTITAVLLGPDAEEEPEPATGFLVGLSAGWNAFTTSATILVTVVGAVLPFAVAIGVPVGAIVWWTRRRSRRARAQA